MRQLRRKTNPKVRDGKVQKRNRTAVSTHPLDVPSRVPLIDRERPGAGYRHFLRKRDILAFIELLPDWDELAVDLQGILLAPGESDCQGWHEPGLVAICAWERELWLHTDPYFYADHAELFQHLGVPCERDDDEVICKFTEKSIRDYQLLHILLHELGHHHDRITTRSRQDAARGEGYAERYAMNYMDEIWRRYAERFGLPGLP